MTKPKPKFETVPYVYRGNIHKIKHYDDGRWVSMETYGEFMSREDVELMIRRYDDEDLEERLTRPYGSGKFTEAFSLNETTYYGCVECRAITHNVLVHWDWHQALSAQVGTIPTTI